MLLFLKLSAKIFSILNGEISPRQIASGIALGALIGLIPIGLLPMLLLLIALILNVNLAMLFVSSAVFKLIGFLFDPVANHIGFAILVKWSFLKPFWTKLYNMPIVPYTNFNNTIVMGSLAAGILLLIPVYLMSRVGIEYYRTKFRERIRNSKLMKALQASTFYKYYLTFQDLRGE